MSQVFHANGEMGVYAHARRVHHHIPSVYSSCERGMQLTLPGRMAKGRVPSCPSPPMCGCTRVGRPLSSFATDCFASQVLELVSTVGGSRKMYGRKDDSRPKYFRQFLARQKPLALSSFHAMTGLRTTQPRLLMLTMPRV